MPIKHSVASLDRVRYLASSVNNVVVYYSQHHEHAHRGYQFRCISPAPTCKHFRIHISPSTLGP